MVATVQKPSRSVGCVQVILEQGLQPKVVVRPDLEALLLLLLGTIPFLDSLLGQKGTKVEEVTSTKGKS